MVHSIDIEMRVYNSARHRGQTPFKMAQTEEQTRMLLAPCVFGDQRIGMMGIFIVVVQNFERFGGSTVQ